MLPDHHRISDNRQKVGSWFGVRVIFSAPNKLEQLCSVRAKKKIARAKNHEMVFSSSCLGDDSKIPLYCGCFYIGQTGRCGNRWMREHAYSTRSDPSGLLAVHCNRRGSEPRSE